MFDNTQFRILFFFKFNLPLKEMLPILLFETKLTHTLLVHSQVIID